MALKKIFIKRTQGEWDTLNQKIEDLNKSDFSAYLRSEIPKVRNKLDECPHCITSADGERKQRVFFITESSYETLQLIADRMKKPLASVVDELFITPLLRIVETA